MASAIDASKPVAGSPTTQSVRDNFATAAAEITALQTAPNQTITLSGDIAGSGTTAITATLPNVNANVGTFQGLTVNAKGLVTAAVNQGYAPVASPSFTGNVTVAGWLAVEGNASPILDVALGVYSALNPPDATAGSVTTGGLFVGNAANPTLYYRNTNHIFNDRSGATSMAQISASGFIVGTPTGGAKGAGTINATTVYAAGVALTSDARLKSDVGDLPADCLGLVAAITPKTFKHLPPPAPELGSGMPGDPAPKAEPTPNFYDRTMWGFMAQDVEAVMAAGGHDFGGHIVSEDGMQSLSYFDLLAVVWKALQEATARIEQLEAGPAAA